MDSSQYDLILSSVSISFNPQFLSSYNVRDRDSVKKDSMTLLENFKNSDQAVGASFQVR